MSVNRVFHKGLGWRVGTSSNISINDDAWIMGATNFKLSNLIPSMHNVRVAELINATTKEWKKEVKLNTFPIVDATRILQIPLALDAHDNLQV